MGVDHLHCRTRDKRSLTMEFVTRSLQNKSEGVCVPPSGFKIYQLAGCERVEIVQSTWTRFLCTLTCVILNVSCLVRRNKPGIKTGPPAPRGHHAVTIGSGPGGGAKIGAPCRYTESMHPNSLVGRGANNQYFFERSEFLIRTLQKKGCVFACVCVCVCTLLNLVLE